MRRPLKVDLSLEVVKDGRLEAVDCKSAELLEWALKLSRSRPLLNSLRMLSQVRWILYDPWLHDSACMVVQFEVDVRIHDDSGNRFFCTHLH